MDTVLQGRGHGIPNFHRRSDGDLTVAGQVAGQWPVRSLNGPPPPRIPSGLRQEFKFKFSTFSDTVELPKLSQQTRLTPTPNLQPSSAVCKATILESSQEPSFTPFPFYTPPFLKVGSCLVFPPSSRPSTIIHFVGGVFIGAAPEVFYSYCIKLLVDAGFLVIATVYEVSLNQTQMAATVQERFSSCLETLDATGLPSASLNPSEILGLPVYIAGHSLGANVISLIGVQEGLYDVPGGPKGSIIMSFGNGTPETSNTAANAEVVQAISSQLGSFRSLLPKPPPLDIRSAEQTLDSIKDTLLAAPLVGKAFLDPVFRFSKAFLPVISDVSNEATGLTPNATQKLELLRTKYIVPATLLVEFEVDPIDDTPDLEEALKTRMSMADSPVKVVERVILPGTHFTPAAPALMWPVGREFSPNDAFLAAAQSSYLREIRATCLKIQDWISCQEDERSGTM